MVAEQEEPLYEAVSAAEEPAAMEGVVEIQEPAPEPGPSAEDDAMKGEYTWEIPNFSTISEQKLYSKNFEIGTHLWRLLVCPQGMNEKGFLSAYLDSPEAVFAPDHLNPKASFKLVLVNQKTPGKGDFFKESSHKWSKTESDWGFTSFILLDELTNPDKGYLLNDTLVLRVEIQVQRNERYAYDSRRETGHVGLKNQGATCYMNSLLQYLYHLPYFRKAVYHMPTDEDAKPSASLPLALQCLFYKLQYCRTPVSTKDLTSSFGWSTMDAFMQHDVQELNRVLCEKLEEKMKGTRVEKVINELFEGHTYNYIECLNVDYKSSRRESFMDLQLDVKGCPNIYASFDKYTEDETMDGENQYKAEGHGLQDARKGVRFDALPPVLQLQLKRFEYDFSRDTMVKINDRYEFYDELDLDRDGGKYLSPTADRSVRHLYKLHSVLVHSGGVHGGHYYAYIRPDGTNWLRFDDTSVTAEDGHKALEEQFGGEDEPGGARPGLLLPGAGAPPAAGPPELLPPGQAPGQGQGPAPAAGAAQAAPGQGPAKPGRLGGLRFTKFSNAYMLVYVRADEWGRLMAPTTKEDIAPYLRERLEAEQRDKEVRQKEKQEAHLYCHVRVATDTDIAAQVGRQQFFDLVDYDRLEPSRTFRVRKLTEFGDFKKQVEASLGVAPEKQRFWVWNYRQNKTYRPTARLKPDEERGTIVDLREHREKEDRGAIAKHALMDLRLYLEVPWPPGSALPVPKAGDINLFFKYYDPAAQALSYVGHRYVPKSWRVSDLMPILAKLAGLPRDTPLDVYEEVKWDPTVMVDLIAHNVQLGTAAQLESGDIIIYQKAVPPLPPGQQQQQQQPGGFVPEGSAAPESMDVEQQQQQPGQAGPQQQQQQQQAQQQPLPGQAQLAAQQQQPAQALLQAAPPAGQQRSSSGGGSAGSGGGGSGGGQGHPHAELLGCRFPRVPEYLAYIRDRRVVHFKRLEEPKEAGLELELLKDDDYDTVTAALAARLHMSDATKLRLTQHNAYSFLPQRNPMRFRGLSKLEDMLRHAGHTTDVLYYETLDLPLPQLETLKSLRIHFHNEKTESVGEHLVRVPRDGCVADVLRELASRLGPELAGAPLRLLEVYNSTIYKVLEPSDEIAQMNDTYWLFRAEAVPADEAEPLPEGDLLIHVHHIAPPKAPAAAASGGDGAAAAAAGGAAGRPGEPAPASANGDAAGGGGGIGVGAAGAAPVTAPTCFGDPFLLRIGRSETLGQVKARIQQKLGVPQAEFDTWRAAFVSVRAAPEYLPDDAVLAGHFAAHQAGVTAEANYLGLQHEDKGPRRPASSAQRHVYERPVKIYN